MVTTIQKAPSTSPGGRVAATPGARLVLRGISWRTYEALLVEMDNRGVRLAYDGKDLEIMTPGHEHEWFRSLIGELIAVLRLELGILVKSAGMTTWRSLVKERGLEADESYYVQNEAVMRARLDYDPETDPPPDLAVEVEISRSVLDRLGIYASLGVPEIWRFDGERLSAWILGADGSYWRSERSRAFPFLEVGDLEPFLGRVGQTDETTWIRSFRAWVRETFADRLPD